MANKKTDFIFVSSTQAMFNKWHERLSFVKHKRAFLITPFAMIHV